MLARHGQLLDKVDRREALELGRRAAEAALAPMLQVFRGMDPPLEPVEIASWAQAPQPDLDDVAPADWVAEGRPDEAVVVSARHSAARLAA